MAVSMLELWQRIQGLEGKTLHTTGRNKPFVVKAVTSYDCIILVESTGKERTISKQEFERSIALGPVSALNTSILRSKGGSEANPAYVLAILRAVV